MLMIDTATHTLYDQARAVILNCNEDSYGLWELDFLYPTAPYPKLPVWHAAVKQALLDMLDEGRLEFIWAIGANPSQDTGVTPEDAAVMIEDESFWQPETVEPHLRFMALDAIPDPSDA